MIVSVIFSGVSYIRGSIIDEQTGCIALIVRTAVSVIFALLRKTLLVTVSFHLIYYSKFDKHQNFILVHMTYF